MIDTLLALYIVIAYITALFHRPKKYWFWDRVLIGTFWPVVLFEYVWAYMAKRIGQIWS